MHETKEGVLMEKREFDPIKGTFPNAKEIQCKDCAFRDKTTVELNGKTIPVGVTKAFCKVYEPPPKTNGKPTAVLFYKGNCKYYMKDE